MSVSSFDGLSISLGSYLAGYYFLLACGSSQLSLVNIVNYVGSLPDSVKDEANFITY